MRLVALSESEIEISWQYSGLRGYATSIERKKWGTENWEQVAIVPDGIVDYLDSGLEPDTRYYYRIRATGGPDVFRVLPFFGRPGHIYAGKRSYRPVRICGQHARIVLTWTDAYMKILCHRKKDRRR